MMIEREGHLPSSASRTPMSRLISSINPKNETEQPQQDRSPTSKTKVFDRVQYYVQYSRARKKHKKERYLQRRPDNERRSSLGPRRRKRYDDVIPLLRFVLSHFSLSTPLSSPLPFSLHPSSSARPANGALYCCRLPPLLRLL